MAIIKCKMCGGDIVLSEDKTYGTCEYCGSTMTFPKVSDEQRLNLFNRANHFRRQNEFDKAIAAYDKILDQDDTDAEAHWGAVLSRYGIEYVEDPVTHERIPTCHRVQLGSILTDADYLAALEHAPDTVSRDLYEKEAKRIAEIQKSILAISSQEKPYDVFICYKETDDSGSRTKDSTFAQDIYYQLTNEGFKVFFSRITLEDKLGQQYEPYIFAALNSAKVMLVIGTRPENFNAVWVKNEWSRYLDLMKHDRNKLLIPCYRDMDPYDLPEELSALQSQDMSKIGFIQDLIRGVKKVLNAGKEPKTAVVAVPTAGPGVTSLHKRAVLFLEDGDWDSASEYFDRILDIDPEYAPAYIGKVQIANKVRKEEGLANCTHTLIDNPDYKKAIRFASSEQKSIYSGYEKAIEDRLDQKHRESIYREAEAIEKRAVSEADYLEAANRYDNAGKINDAMDRAVYCRNMAAQIKEETDQREQERLQREEQRRIEQARIIEEHRRREELNRIEEQKKNEERLKREEQDRLIAEKQRAERKKKNKRKLLALLSIIMLVTILGGVYNFLLKPKMAYDQALSQLENGQYDDAIAGFESLKTYMDSPQRVLQAKANKCYSAEDYASVLTIYEDLDVAYQDHASDFDNMYHEAERHLEAGEYDQSIEGFSKLGNYLDSPERLLETKYKMATSYAQDDRRDDAISLFEALGDYSDSASKAQQLKADSLFDDNKLDKAWVIYNNLDKVYNTHIDDYNALYQAALLKRDEGDYEAAVEALNVLGDYGDSKEQIKATQYQQAEALWKVGEYSNAEAIWKNLSDYSDSQYKAIQSQADALFSQGAYAEAWILFDKLPQKYHDHDDDYESKYNVAIAEEANREYSAATDSFCLLGSYMDALQHAATCALSNARQLIDNDQSEEAVGILLGFERFPQDTWNQDEIQSLLETAADDCQEKKAYEQATLAYEYLAKNNYGMSVMKLPVSRYAYANQLFENKEYERAAEQFSILGDTADSKERFQESLYQFGIQLLDSGDYQSANEAFSRIVDYSNAEEMVQESDYRYAKTVMDENKYEDAAALFDALGDYSDSNNMAKECWYLHASSLMSSDELESAQKIFENILTYKDSLERKKECIYRRALLLKSEDKLETSVELFEQVSDYKDSGSQIDNLRLQLANNAYTKGDIENAYLWAENVSCEEGKELFRRCNYDYGIIEEENQNETAAIRFFSKALPNRDARQKLLDVAYSMISLNQPEKATETLWFLGNDEEAQKRLSEIAELLQGSGKKVEASIAYLAMNEGSKAYSLNPDTSEIEEALSQYTLTDDDLFKNSILYYWADQLLQNGINNDAYYIYSLLRNYDYLDSSSIINSSEPLYERDQWWKQFGIGGEFDFGHWDGENISWIITYKQGNVIMLASKYMIDYGWYWGGATVDQPSIEYEASDIGKWMKSFYAKAFSKDQQASIQEVNLGHVFTLAYSDLDTYLPYEYRHAEPTDNAYAKAREGYSGFNVNGWLLQGGAYYIYDVSRGECGEKGYYRPFLFLDLDAYYKTIFPNTTESTNGDDLKAQNTEEETTKDGTPAKLVDGWHLSDDEKYAVQPSELVKKSEGVYTLNFKVRNQNTGKTIYDKQLEFKADGELSLTSDNVIQDFSLGKDGKYRFTVVCDKKEGTSVEKFTKKISFKAK